MSEYRAWLQDAINAIEDFAVAKDLLDNVDELEAENARLKRENEGMRDMLQSIRDDSMIDEDLDSQGIWREEIDALLAAQEPTDA